MVSSIGVDVDAVAARALPWSYLMLWPILSTDGSASSGRSRASAVGAGRAGPARRCRRTRPTWAQRHVEGLARRRPRATDADQLGAHEVERRRSRCRARRCPPRPRAAIQRASEHRRTSRSDRGAASASPPGARDAGDRRVGRRRAAGGRAGRAAPRPEPRDQRAEALLVAGRPAAVAASSARRRSSSSRQRQRRVVVRGDQRRDRRALLGVADAAPRAAWAA